MKWEMKVNDDQKSTLKVRTGPSESYKVAYKVNSGDTITVTDSKTVGNKTWYKIDGSDNWIGTTKGSNDLTKVKDLAPTKNTTTPNPTRESTSILSTRSTNNNSTIKQVVDSQSSNNNNYIKGLTGSSNWYVPSKYSNLETGNVRGQSMDQYQVVDDSTITNEIQRIRYNMDIAYMEKSDLQSNIFQSSGYFSNLQAKIHNSFNRNKVCFPDYHLNKTFAYVFFTRPDLNICTYSGGGWSLTDQAKGDPKYDYLFANNSMCMRSLVSNGNPYHKFLVLLSNQAESFEVADKVIQTSEHGETFSGNRVMYGGTDHESNSAGEMTIRYIDSVNLDIYKMHEVWTDYINGVTRSRFTPKREYVKGRILDYASSCYYFLLAPDGCTILYWQKLTGVFPVNTGENAFSWDSGTLLAKPEVTIKYVYSMKTPLDVSHLKEFNTLVTANGNIKEIYRPDNCGTGSTLTHAPYIVPMYEHGRMFYKLLWLDN